MRRLLRRLRGDRKGVTAIEFALIAPLFIFLIVAVTQVGGLFYAHAALRNAVSEGARFATVFPRPTEAQVIARVNAHRGPGGGTYGTPAVVYQLDTATGNWRASVSMTYTASFNFILFRWNGVTFTYSRRAWVHAPPA